MVNVEDINLDTIKGWIKPRPVDAHKGLFGNVLVIGGDYGMPGSVRLAAEAALRVGAGVVTVVTRKEHIGVVVCGRPELLCYGVDSSIEILDILLEKATVIVIGPGLGQSAWSLCLFNKIISLSTKLILDADALNLLAKLKKTPKNSANWIITPHPGEAGRLLGIPATKVQLAREKSILQLQDKYSCSVVLKGYNTLMAFSNTRSLKRCISGNSGMATAGMGDLLSGIIAGLVAIGLSLSQAAQAGVLLHAHAGDLAMRKIDSNSVLASDVLRELKLP